MALLTAWLLLLGLVAAVFGYVLFLPAPQETQVARLPPVTLELPPEEPAAPPQTKAEAPPEPPAPPPGGQQAAPEPAPPAETTTAQTPTQPAEAPTEPGQKAASAEPSAAPEPASAAKPAETQEALVVPPPPPPAAKPMWQRNAQAFDVADQRPRIAVVITELGLSSAATEAAIKQLPGAITLSFTPYSRRLNEWIALARVNGHEVMLDLPMEPTSYPDDDPGPQALLTALSVAQNQARLDWALGRATGYVGVVPVMGSRFTASEEQMKPVLERIKSRGLLFLDNHSSDHSVAAQIAQGLGMPNAVNDRFLDLSQASHVAIDARLVQLERIARTEGHAVAIGLPYPVTIERLRDWADKVESRGFALAPITAVVSERLARKTAARKAETQ
jgi:polysaccharide deacetylase 2 family uncharacterized protein YibQ